MSSVSKVCRVPLGSFVSVSLYYYLLFYSVITGPTINLDRAWAWVCFCFNYSLYN